MVDPFWQIRPLLAWMQECTPTECKRTDHSQMPPTVVAAWAKYCEQRESIALDVWHAGRAR